MSEYTTPRRNIKAALEGETLWRPLLIPIVFNLGAHLENLPLEQFLSNPTKIANALRQIHNALKLDGVTCYFDPFLEAEALGCAREWHADGSSYLRNFPAGIDQARKLLSFRDSLLERRSIAVACDVVRRLKVTLQDEPVLVVCTTGPASLASQLCSCSKSPIPEWAEILTSSAEVTASISKSFLEAGADVIFFREEVVPELPAEICGVYGSLLEPIFNVTRFYEAVPVMLIGAQSSQAISSVLPLSTWDCVFCATVRSLNTVTLAQPRRIGLALPDEIWYGQEQLRAVLDLKDANSNNPILLTSERDLSRPDVKQLSHTVASLRAA